MTERNPQLRIECVGERIQSDLANPKLFGELPRDVQAQHGGELPLDFPYVGIPEFHLDRKGLAVRERISRVKVQNVVVISPLMLAATVVRNRDIEGRKMGIAHDLRV
jgi:hypothetical protein